VLPLLWCLLGFGAEVSRRLSLLPMGEPGEAPSATRSFPYVAAFAEVANVGWRKRWWSVTDFPDSSVP